MNKGMIEVEIKIPISTHGFENIQEKIQKLGGKYLNSELQQDTYYDHPCKSFQESDEAVRVRSRIPITNEELITDHTSSELVYKGPKLDTKSKTRLEISIAIPDSSTAKSMLEQLGFRKLATIVKKRVFFKQELTTICLDDVEEVGTFMELERLVSPEEELEPVRKQLFNIVKNLGIKTEESVRESYLELYLEKTNQ
jgi:adenylate cyclase class 2